jgi:hypothetical protein
MRKAYQRDDAPPKLERFRPPQRVTRNGKGWMAKCPAHDDTNPFASQSS